MKNRSGLICIGLTISLGIAVHGFGQEIPLLERTVSISFNEESVQNVLTQLSQKGSFTFSYNPAILEGSRKVTASFINRSVREILNTLFSGSLEYKERGNYIILVKAPAPPQKASVDRSVTIRGYVVDGETGGKLRGVSVYDKKSLTGVISSEFGYFQLKLDREPGYAITFSKKSFMDTTVSVTSGMAPFVTVVMIPEHDVQSFSAGDLAPDSLPVPLPVITPLHEPPAKESQINMENIRDTLYNDLQVSLLPFVGTNQMLSGNVISDYSFNILGGYTFGVKKLEIGGLFNVDRGDVKYVQLAGIFNAVGGEIRGMQAAGIVNLNRGRLDGTQFGGILNVNLSAVEGPQFAGILNVNGSSSRGAQFAGIGNVQVMDYRGSQFAGIFNVATHQIAGTQVAGVANFGRTIHGAQIGLFNISDSIHGIPFGLLSVVKKGYHKIELSWNEIFHTNLAFRTGVHQFYNIFAAGADPGEFNDPLWYFGYGLGTSPRLTRWLYFNFDLTSSHVSRGHINEGLSLLNQVCMGFDFQIAKKFSITAGATLNGYLTNNGETHADLFAGYHPHFVHDDDIGHNSHLQMWWGGKVGVRFF